MKGTVVVAKKWLWLGAFVTASVLYSLQFVSPGNSDGPHQIESHLIATPKKPCQPWKMRGKFVAFEHPIESETSPGYPYNTSRCIQVFNRYHGTVTARNAPFPYQFIPDDDCELQEWDPFAFLEMFRNREITISGDSMSQQIYVVLICGLEAPFFSSQKKWDPALLPQPSEQISPTHAHEGRKWYFPTHNVTVHHVWHYYWWDTYNKPGSLDAISNSSLWAPMVGPWYQNEQDLRLELQHFLSNGSNPDIAPKQLCVIVFEVVLWIVASAGTVLLNKYILYELNFRFPLFLTLCQALFATAGTRALRILTKRTEEFAVERKSTSELTLPISILYSISLMASNIAYLHLTAAYIVVLKASTPAITLILRYSLRKEGVVWALFRSMIVIAGVFFVTYPETQILVVALMFQVIGIISEAARIAITPQLRPERQIDALQLLHDLAPVCACASGVGFLLLEASHISISQINALGILLLLNCFVAFLANLEPSVMAGKASTVVATGARFVRDALVITTSTLWWSTTTSVVQILGYSIVMIGALWYPDRQRVTVLLVAMVLLPAVWSLFNNTLDVNIRDVSNPVTDIYNRPNYSELIPTAPASSTPRPSPSLPPKKASPLRSLIAGQRLAPSANKNSSNPKVLLLGIFSTAQKFGRRQLIRSTYLQHRTSRTDVIFVIGKPKNDVMGTYVALENQLFSDILVLNIPENMNEGKTYEYFAAVGREFGDDEYLYVAKTDDDSFILLPRLEHRLDVEGAVKRTGAYFGHQWDFYMHGWGYGLSWDLVKWLAYDPYPKAHTIPGEAEDKQIGLWLRDQHKTQHFWTFDKTEFYEPPRAYRSDFKRNVTMNSTILLHSLKSDIDFIVYTRMLLLDIVPPEYRTHSAS
ncbi:hypothetical protein SmJEL517_g02356 [Synchytrium microbalum]|uniref:Uncharacterized protein n=1 Tax=Synchytrium microbalum TaxID=1806994 RepID=A0A507CBG3_9FUNG|nr:uncharacterized protein SmJEL517_g02356 [Synchytrium microbalum]TPX35294.1 hypothetical protein SmJEL517_g02356 [Synchytrium microbalum]